LASSAQSGQSHASAFALEADADRVVGPPDGPLLDEHAGSSQASIVTHAAAAACLARRPLFVWIIAGPPARDGTRFPFALCREYAYLPDDQRAPRPASGGTAAIDVASGARF
jgi:hypothetical protein